MYNDNRKTIILIVLGIVIVSISIAYATLATNLNIGGVVNTPSVDWDIHFYDFSSANTPANTTSGEVNTGEIKSVTTSGTAITNLKAEFKKPGDSIVYSFKIKNFGSISAKLNTFTQTVDCSDNTCDNVSYAVECLDSSSNSFVQNSTLAPNQEITCSLTLKFKDNATITRNTDDVSASIYANWNFSQN